METEDQNNQSLQLKYLELIRDVNEYSSIRLLLGHDDHRLNFSQSLTRYKVKKKSKILFIVFGYEYKKKTVFYSQVQVQFHLFSFITYNVT